MKKERTISWNFQQKCNTSHASHNTCDGWLATPQEADSWTTGQSPRCRTAHRLPIPLHCILQTKEPGNHNKLNLIKIIIQSTKMCNTQKGHEQSVVRERKGHALAPFKLMVLKWAVEH